MALVSANPAKTPRVSLKWHLLLAAPLLAIAQYSTGILRLGGDALIIVGYGLYAWILAIITATMNEVGRDIFTSRLLHALLVAWLIGFMLQLLQWSGVDSLWLADTGRSRPAGNLTQPNHFATWTVLSACGALWLDGRSRWPRFVLPALIVCIAFSLALAASRTGYLAVAVCTGWAWWHALLAKRKPKQSTATHLGQARYFTALLGLTAVAVAMRPTIESALFGQDSAPALVRYYDSERLRLLAFAAQAALEKPWTGWGIYQTPLAQTTSAGGEGLIHQLYPSAHNLFADLIIWLGVPLGSLICVLIGFAIVRALRPCTDHPDRLSLQGMLLALVLHAMLEYPLYYLMWLGVFVVLLVILTDPPAPSHSSSNSVVLRWTTLRALSMATAVAVAAGLMTSYVALQDRRATYYLEGRCVAASPLSAIIWQRYEMTLDLLCDQPLPSNIKALDLSVLAGSSEALHKLHASTLPGTPERHTILRAGCRLGAFSHYCRALNRDTND